MENAARQYLHGLFQSSRRNMECMAETVAESGYQQLHHMLSESHWDRREVRRQLVADANDHFGYASGLLIDESGFAKKGELSAGVARQWNGRLGKTDNCQVGVFAAVARDGVASLVDTELYLPSAWSNDAARCEAAGVPEDRRAFRTKGEIALELVRRLRRDGLRFSFVAFDGGYGHLPWLLRELDGERETFLAEVHSDQAIFLDDPAPAIPDSGSSKGRAPSRLRTDASPASVAAWAAAQPAAQWRRLSIRGGEKGEVIADYLTQRVWVWDGKSPSAHRWHLLVRREMDGTTLKFCLSNTKPGASLRRLAEMQAARHFVERSFEDAKSACGMADYQVRRWQAWHHHMALVMIATMFLAKERLAHRDTADLLSCRDLVEIMRHKLPLKIVTDEDLAASIANRHTRRRRAMDSAYRRQQEMHSASNCNAI
ncbi:MAG: IS701 family transposase [Candidatus Accumulibacter sp.]|nr:IS701 family transposase [Accumulibacter sp.]